MNRRLVAASLSAVLVAGCASGEPAHDRAAIKNDGVAPLASSLNDAGFALFAAADADENLALSPVSIGLAFGMAHAGASGDAKDALRDFFDYPADNGALLDAFNSLDQTLASEAGDGGRNSMGETVDLPIVRIANRVFVDKGFAPRDTYLATVSRYFGASAQELPMSTNPAAARKAIDAWVNERTEGLIPKVMPENLPSPDTRLMLANTVYLKAQWMSPFDKDMTAPRSFTTGSGTSIDAEAMRQDLRTSYVRGDNFDAAVLPYVGDLEMILVVPHEGQIGSVTNELSSSWLGDLDSQWVEDTVTVQLPTFESTSELTLRELIEDRLGATGIFGTAGLDGIAPDLVISDAIHATKVIVDEAGTEAAAATIIAVEATSAMPTERPEVIADKPFLYLIRNTTTGAVLFIGRIVDPTAG